MGWVSWTVRLAAGLVIGSVVVGLSAPAVAGSGPRQMLGTVSAQGDVRLRSGGDGRHDDGEALSRSGSPLLEGTLVTTGPKSAALLNLSSDGMIGLRAGGAVEAGVRGTDGLRVTLWIGEVLVRIPLSSRLTLATATGTIRPDTLMPVVAGPMAAAEASVKLLPDGQTVVQVQTGSLRIEGAEGGPTVVRAGEQATLMPDAAPRLVATAATADAAPTPAVGAPAAKGKAGASVFAVDSDLAILVGLGSAVVVGGTVGGLVASGQFSSDDHVSNDHVGAVTAGATQGSAFRAPR